MPACKTSTVIALEDSAALYEWKGVDMHVDKGAKVHRKKTILWITNSNKKLYTKALGYDMENT